jgi:UrcA family protein
MPHRSLKPTHCALLAAAAGVMLGAAPALAQDYGGYGPAAYSGPPEDVIVVAPRERFREQGGTLDLPPDKVSLSTRVRYDDLDLLTWDGAQTLRARVREAARRVCRHLAEAYPFQRLSTAPSCYRETVENGLLRADEAINAVQDDYLYGYE